MSPVLEARAVGFSYGRHSPLVVDSVDLEIAAGETVGIVGESGSGKTTLGRLLVGALEPTAGAVAVEGRPWREVKRRDPIRRRVQMVFQDPYGSLNPRQTPLDVVSEVIRVWESVGAAAANLRAEELLAEVGLAGDAMRRTPRRLSGGQCQRVGIARALAADPEILVADEPTSSLDLSVQAQILNLLRELRNRRDLALVLITHDLSIVHYASDRAIVMYGGQVIEEGPTDLLMNSPSHPYTKVLVASIPGQEGEADTVAHPIDRSGGCVFAPRCPFVHDACLDARPALAGEERKVACVLREAELESAA